MSQKEFLLEKIYLSLPVCQGEWLSGSGGRARFSGNCKWQATWTDNDWVFCDDHKPIFWPYIHECDILEFEYSDEVRDYRKFLEGLQSK